MGNRFFQLAYLWAQYREGKIPDIYLQDYRYFDFYRDEIREMFKQVGEPIDAISIHIRKGKNPSRPEEPAYNENPFYAHLTDDYYEKAKALFPNKQFMVFDDVSGKDELEDFSKMTRCKGHIIANSSYSFWAAYIGGGKTVAPSQWFSNGTRIPY